MHEPRGVNIRWMGVRENLVQGQGHGVSTDGVGLVA